MFHTLAEFFLAKASLHGKEDYNLCEIMISFIDKVKNVNLRETQNHHYAMSTHCWLLQLVCLVLDY